MEESMNRPKMMFAVLTVGATFCGTPQLLAQENLADPVLAEAMEDTTISLQQGLAAAATKGRPISAKFEIENGKLQLSIYTAKGRKFGESIIDLSSGKIAKSETITDHDDLADAKAQSAAMAKTRTSLRVLADKAVHDSTGYLAVSVTPAVKNGQSVASVVLLKGNELKAVDLPLK
jgi:hypothetical protein